MSSATDLGHQLDQDCACGPVCEPVDRPDGSFAWLYVHRGPGAETPAFLDTVAAARAMLASAHAPSEGSVVPSNA